MRSMTRAWIPVALSLAIGACEGTVHDGASSDTCPGCTESAESLHAPATRLVFSLQPRSVGAGGFLTLAASAVDSRGRTDTSFRGAITISKSPRSAGSGALGANQATKNAISGVATFGSSDGLHFDIAGSYAVAASALGLTQATSANFSVFPAAAKALVFTSQPAAGVAGQPLAPPVEVSVVDGFGNVVTSRSRAISLSLTGGTAGAKLVGGGGTDTVRGVASFGSLWLDKAGSTYTLTASTAGLSPAASDAFAIVAGAPHPSGSSLAASSSSAFDDGTPVELVAIVGDRFGNAVSGATALVSSSGAATLTQPSAPSDADGRAVGSASSLVSGPQTFSASVEGVILATATVTFTAAPVSSARSTVTPIEPWAPADGSSVATVIVTVVDAIGRPFGGRPVSLVYSGTATPSPALATTDADGVATFTLRSAQPTSGSLTATVNPDSEPVVLAETPSLAFVSTYQLGGTVRSLSGAGLILRAPGQPDLPVASGATSFTFAHRLPAGSPYQVSVGSQPGGQVCEVQGGSGSLEADISDIVVDCVSRWKMVATGSFFTLGIKSDGSLWAWGRNSNGQLGDGTTVDRPKPVRVGENFAFVAAGISSSLGIKADGTLWGWGSNFAGTLGDGTKTDRHTPVLIGSGYTFVDTLSAQTLALKTDGTLWTWGTNTFGLGDGTTTSALSPILLGSEYSAAAVGSGFCVAVKTDGTLWSWGYNSTGQLGDGTTTNRSIPLQIGTSFTSVSAGPSHTVALQADGTLWAFGQNYSGQLGDGTSSSRKSPVQIGAGFTAASTGETFTIAVKGDGSLWSWGSDGSGQLAQGIGGVWRYAPAQVATGFASIAAGASHAAGIKADGTLWLWGGAALGDGALSQTSLPLQVGAGYAVVAAGDDHSAGVRLDGTLWAWGSNRSGQIGDGSRFQRSRPVLVGDNFASVAAGMERTAGIKRDGSLWMWGSNYQGALGDGTSTARSTPVEVGGEFRQVGLGFSHTVGLKTDGTVWTWGSNSYGELGDGTPIGRAVPAQVGAGFVAVAAGDRHTLAIDSDGALWAWGDNYYCQLGDGTTESRSSPVRIADGFVAVAGASYDSYALKADGTLWAWGFNYVGELGDGTKDQHCEPVLIANGVAAVTARSIGVAAIDPSGALLSWSENRYGQVGDGTTVDRLSPVQVGGGFASVTRSGLHALAVKLDGTLWAWGLGTSGQLGNGGGNQVFPMLLP